MTLEAHLQFPEIFFPAVSILVLYACVYLIVLNCFYSRLLQMRRKRSSKEHLLTKLLFGALKNN